MCQRRYSYPFSSEQILLRDEFIISEIPDPDFTLISRSQESVYKSHGHDYDYDNIYEREFEKPETGPQTRSKFWKFRLHKGNKLFVNLKYHINQGWKKPKICPPCQKLKQLKDETMNSNVVLNLKEFASTQTTKVTERVNIWSDVFHSEEWSVICDDLLGKSSSTSSHEKNSKDVKAGCVLYKLKNAKQETKNLYKFKKIEKRALQRQGSSFYLNVDES